jgi:hypothetical protein
MQHLTPQPRKTSASEGVARKFNKFAANIVDASTAGSSNQMAGERWSICGLTFSASASVGTLLAGVG